MRMMVVVVISIISATLKLVVVVKYQDRDRLGMLSRPNNNNPIKDNGMSGETKNVLGNGGSQYRLTIKIYTGLKPLRIVG